MPISGTVSTVRVPDIGGTGATAYSTRLLSPATTAFDDFTRSVGATNYSTAVQDAVAPISPMSDGHTIYYGANGQSTTTAFSCDWNNLVITGTGATQNAAFYTTVTPFYGGFTIQATIAVSVLGPAGVGGPNINAQMESADSFSFAAFQVNLNNTGVAQFDLFDGVGGFTSALGYTFVAATVYRVIWSCSASGYQSITVYPEGGTVPAAPQLTWQGGAVLSTGHPFSKFSFGSNPRDCTNTIGLFQMRADGGALMVPGVPMTVGFPSVDWNDMPGVTSDGQTVSFGTGSSGRYHVAAYAQLVNSSVPSAVTLVPNNTDPGDVVSETDNRASTANTSLAQTGNPVGQHEFFPGDTLTVQATQYSSTIQLLSASSLNMVRLDTATPPTRPNNFLIAFTTGYNGTMSDASTHPWTLLSGQTQFAYPVSNPGCGAGPPQNQFYGVWARQIVPGESAAVMSNGVGGSTTCGMFVVEVGGCDFSSLALIGPTFTVVPSGADSVVSATSSTKIAVLGCTLFAKVDYDGGWCTGWPVTGNVVNQKTGVQLFNASGANGCAGTPPWVYVGAASGGGTVTTACHADSHGGGSGAYNCGWAVVQVGLRMNVVTKFSVVQSAGAGFGPPGGTVSLPNPPSQ